MWSPDGTSIAFERDGDLWTMDGSGAHQMRVVSAADHPTWAPDGRRLAFERNGEIWIVNADGSGEHIVPLGQPDLPVYALEPDWSPDGARIAMSVGTGAPASQIWAAAPDGSGFGLIADYTDFNREPDWAPDGTRLAWEGHCCHHAGAVVVVDGTAVTPDFEPVSGHPDEGIVWIDSRWPTWSPDGRLVAYQSNIDQPQGSTSDIWEIPLSAGPATKVIADAAQPDWQALTGPDCSVVTAHPAVLSPADGRLHPVELQAPAGAGLRLRVGDVTISESAGPGEPDVRTGPRANVVYLRAERDPAGPGCTYTIHFVGEGAGGRCTGAVTVTVPLRQP